MLCTIFTLDSENLYIRHPCTLQPTTFLPMIHPPTYPSINHHSPVCSPVHHSFIGPCINWSINQSIYYPSIYILIHPSIYPSSFGFFLYLCVHNPSTHPSKYAHIIHSFIPFLSSHQSIHSSSILHQSMPQSIHHFSVLYLLIHLGIPHSFVPAPICPLFSSFFHLSHLPRVSIS